MNFGRHGPLVMDALNERLRACYNKPCPCCTNIFEGDHFIHCELSKNVAKLHNEYLSDNKLFEDKWTPLINWMLWWRVWCETKNGKRMNDFRIKGMIPYYTEKMRNIIVRKSYFKTTKRKIAKIMNKKSKNQMRDSLPLISETYIFTSHHIDGNSLYVSFLFISNRRNIYSYYATTLEFNSYLSYLIISLLIGLSFFLIQKYADIPSSCKIFIVKQKISKIDWNARYWWTATNIYDTNPLYQFITNKDAYIGTQIAHDIAKGEPTNLIYKKCSYALNLKDSSRKEELRQIFQ